MCLKVGGKDLAGAPSPMGEGWEGGITNKKIVVLFMIPDAHILFFRNYEFAILNQ